MKYFSQIAVAVFSFGALLLPAWSFAAIAFDAADSGHTGSGTTVSWTASSAGADETYVIYTWYADTSTTNMSCTVDGNAATLVNTIAASGAGNDVMAAFFYNGTSNAAASIVCTSAGSAVTIDGVSASYTGVLGGLDGSDTLATHSNTFTLPLVTTIDNDWTVLGGFEQGDTLTASTNANFRVSSTINLYLFDSGAPITPPQSFPMTFTATGADYGQGIIIGLAPTASGGGGTATTTEATSTALIAQMQTDQAENNLTAGVYLFFVSMFGTIWMLRRPK